MSLEYVIILAVFGVPIMVLMIRLTISLMLYWRIAEGVWMLPL
ncbi:hypothetical protein SAMN05428995_10411 [Loktanella sp. DSM 29012]|nr:MULTISPECIES: hypothetical protein [Loktanella]SEQ35745.1 hypothetical protein SAMN05428995_10411 [Loktanella sp. DSM 29012]